jgi:hypothetical protein
VSNLAFALGVCSTAPPATPATIVGKTSLAFWYESDFGVTADGTGVTTWTDQSPNNRTLGQGTHAVGPAFVASGGGGNQPYLAWTANSAQILKAAFSLSTPYEVFIVLRQPTAADPHFNYIFDASSDVVGLQVPGDLSLATNFGAATVDLGAQPGEHIVNLQFPAATNGILQLDSEPPITGTSVVPASTGIFVGSNTGDIGTNSYGGWTYAVIGVTRACTPTERANMITWARRKYNFPFYQSVVQTNAAWNEPQSGSPQGRDGLMISWAPANSVYWLFAGWNPSIPAWGNTTTNELWSSPDAYTWTQIQTHNASPSQSGPSARPRPRHGGQIFPHVCQDGVSRLVLIASDVQDSGGWPGNPSGYQSDVWTWDGTTWVPKTLTAAWGTGSGAVWGQMACSIPNGGGAGGHSMLYVFGGQTTQSAGSAVNAVWSSADDGVTWTQISNAPWAARSHSFCSQTIGFGNGQKIVMACGGGYDNVAVNQTPQHDVWSFDGTTWTQLTANFGGLARNYCNTVWWAAKGLLVLADGFNGGAGGVGNLNDCWTSPDGVTWTRRFVTPWAATHADSLVTSPSSPAVYRQGGITLANADQVKIQALTSV